MFAITVFTRAFILPGYNLALSSFSYTLSFLVVVHFSVRVKMLLRVFQFSRELPYETNHSLLQPIQKCLFYWHFLAVAFTWASFIKAPYEHKKSSNTNLSWILKLWLTSPNEIWAFLTLHWASTEILGKWTFSPKTLLEGCTVPVGINPSII